MKNKDLAVLDCALQHQVVSGLASISSSVRPRVSGTHKRMKMTPNTHTAPKIANTAYSDIAEAMIGNKRPTRNEPIQLKEDASPVPEPRIANGNISPTITQVKGAHVNEYSAT